MNNLKELKLDNFNYVDFEEEKTKYFYDRYVYAYDGPVFSKDDNWIEIIFPEDDTQLSVIIFYKDNVRVYVTVYNTSELDYLEEFLNRKIKKYF